MERLDRTGGVARARPRLRQTARRVGSKNSCKASALDPVLLELVGLNLSAQFSCNSQGFNFRGDMAASTSSMRQRRLKFSLRSALHTI